MTNVCSHCLSAGQDESEAGLAAIEAYWIEDGTTDGEVFEVCVDCFDASAPDQGYAPTSTPLYCDPEGKIRPARCDAERFLSRYDYSEIDELALDAERECSHTDHDIDAGTRAWIFADGSTITADEHSWEVSR